MKSDRHKKILELIADNNIGTQEELADALNKAGYNVTQATVSRDIRALNLTKVTIDGVNQKYTTLSHSSPVPNDKYIRVLKEGYLSMDMAQNILVISLHDTSCFCNRLNRSHFIIHIHDRYQDRLRA